MEPQTHRDWPDVVEIEVNRHCNRKCEYCPNSVKDLRGQPAYMEIELFRHIISMLQKINFTGRLSFHFYNEPLIRNDLEQLVTLARPELPKAHFVLYTNGDLLTDERHERLLKAGIDLFLVTRHDWDSYPKRSFQRVQVPSDFAISSRGGTVVPVSGPLNIPCYGPSEMLIVTATGDVVLCHEDACREHIMGNLGQQDLTEIWKSAAFEQVRKPLEAGLRNSGPKICSNCDNRLYPVPGAAI